MSSIDVVRQGRKWRESSIEPHRAFIAKLIDASIEAEEPVTVRSIQSALQGRRGVTFTRDAVKWFMRNKMRDEIERLREHGLYGNGLLQNDS